MSYEAAQPETIQALFGKIAARYDLGNAILSLGLFHQWNRRLVRALGLHKLSTPLLDLCSGTGEITRLAIKMGGRPEQAYCLDFCPEMLEVAARRLAGESVEMICGDAQSIPLADQSVDRVAQAYGLRNVRDRELCMREVFRVLRPGGRWGILELTLPSPALLRKVYSFYLCRILPYLGGLVSGDYGAYRYLSRSILDFPPVPRISEMLKGVGFDEVSSFSISGGAATLWIAVKD
jgi:demethylmenaquinone methyltransferase / 2-methoxy-6-polyprenyl-1,4-benzoquinol methylase